MAHLLPAERTGGAGRGLGAEGTACARDHTAQVCEGAVLMDVNMFNMRLCSLEQNVTHNMFYEEYETCVPV